MWPSLISQIWSCFGKAANSRCVWTYYSHRAAGSLRPAAPSASPSAAPHLPWFHGLFMRVNVYRSALNNICRGLGSAARKTNGGRDRAHHWLKGTGTVSGSIRYRPEIQQTTGPRCRAWCNPDEFKAQGNIWQKEKMSWQLAELLQWNVDQQKELWLTPL